MLKVAKKTDDKEYHIIKIKKWEYGGQHSLTSLMIQFFCEEKAHDRTPTKGSYTNYSIKDLDKSKQKFCKDCVKGIKLAKKRAMAMKKLQASRK